MVGGGVAVTVIAIILASGGGTPPPPVEDVKAKPEVGWTNERVQAVVKWAKAVADGNRIDLAITTDLDAFQRRFAMGDSRMVSTMSGDDRSKLKEQILDALLTKDDSKILREFEPYGGRLVDAAMVASGTGRVTIDVSAKEEVRARYTSEGTIEFSFSTRDGKLLVDGFSVTSAPAVKVEKVARAPKPGHTTIARPEGIERVIDGKKFKIWETEVVPLDHLADTAPEMRAEIDRLVTELVRLDLVPRERTKIKNRLRDIGKPAVPRLLTRFNDIKADSEDGIAQLTQIDALLRDMSGQAFGFSPAQNTALSSAEANEKARTSALRQWYGWWYYYHDRPLDIAFDKEDEELLEKPKKPKIK